MRGKTRQTGTGTLEGWFYNVLSTEIRTYDLKIINNNDTKMAWEGRWNWENCFKSNITNIWAGKT